MAEKDYRMSKKKGFVNPYTFVPVQTENVLRRDAEDYYQKEKLHTGVLHCSLYVRTPLAIPDIEQGHPIKGKHMKYPFYRENGICVIPGSSIRGMLRSVYETATASCFSTLKDDELLSKRVDSRNAYKPGILKKENGAYVLYRAKRYLVPVSTYSRIRAPRYFEVVIQDGMRKIKSEKNQYLGTGTPVLFQYVSCDIEKRGRKLWEGIITGLNQAPHGKGGLLYVGEPIKNKHGESVFVYGSEEKDTFRGELSGQRLEQAYVRMLRTLDTYRNEAINKNLKDKDSARHGGYAGYEKLKPENGIPLWYKIEKDGEIHFSCAAIGRTMYDNTLNMLVGELNRCADRKHLCEACLLFGMVGGNGEENQGMGSRIRVTDAYAAEKPDMCYSTLKELGAPRYSYLPFYAKNGMNGEIPSSYDEKGTEINGRKYYWHNKRTVDAKIYETDDLSDRNATLELVLPGERAVFSFDIYYDGISDEQLEKLLWTVTLGKNGREASRCHKLGHGKPLGLGSVKVVVEEHLERILDQTGYHMLPHTIETCDEAMDELTVKYVKEMLGIGDQELQEKMQTAVEALRKVVDMNQPFCGENAAYNIEYPNLTDRMDAEIPASVQQKQNAAARHQWYSQNKNNRNFPTQPLPDLLGKEQVLAAIQYLAYQEEHVQASCFEKGKLYKAKVTGFNTKKTAVYISVNGERGQIYFREIPGAQYGAVDKNLMVGQSISVQYIEGKQENGKTYHNFRMKNTV